VRVALIDPSLFTLPYDAALATGLRACGHDVVLHGRKLRDDDGEPAGVVVTPSFYRVAGMRAFDAMPTPLRLGIKGVDHVVSMAGLRARLARDRPDIIHFQWLPLPVIDCRFIPAIRPIAPVVLTVHDSNPFNGDPTTGLQRRGVAMSFARCDRIIVHTEQGRLRLVEQGVKRARITVLPHGLLGAGQPPPTGDRMSDEITFLLFGKLKAYKGLDLLIEAFARLPSAMRAVARVRAVGKPYMDLAPLVARAEALGIASRVSIEPRFVAEAEIPAILAPGTIATFPYREIEASGVLSLALAHGRPILASRIGGFAELVRDGIDGMLVPPDDVASLAAAMARFLAERRFAADCARHVRDLAASVPDWTEIARRTAAVYAASLRDDRGGRRAA